MGTFAPHPETPILRNRIQPDRKRPGVVDFPQMRQGAHQYFLHCVFRILTMAAHLHAEGENRLLQ